MRLLHLSSVVFSILLLHVSAAPTQDGIQRRQASPYAGYLITTFSDPNPAVQFHLSIGNDPGRYVFSNRGKAVLKSTVGTKGVRDTFLTTNSARSQWFIIATGKRYCSLRRTYVDTPADLDINKAGFSWDKATRTGSRGIVVWKSSNLLDWSGPTLVK
jgi:hypothetical protein